MIEDTLRSSPCVSVELSSVGVLEQIEKTVRGHLLLARVLQGLELVVGARRWCNLVQEELQRNEECEQPGLVVSLHLALERVSCDKARSLR